jgi:hypothetical protein
VTIENFNSAYPANETFVSDVSRRPEFGSFSPVGFMARIYLREGAHGLRHHGEDHDRAVSLGDNAGIQTAASNRDKNKAAVLLGAAVISIEEILSDCEFDQMAFNSRMEDAYRGARAPDPRVISNPIAEKIEKDDIEKILSVVRVDKTFGNLFRSAGLGNLPLSMRVIIRGSELTRYSNGVLDEFVKRVALIQEAKKNGKLPRP